MSVSGPGEITLTSSKTYLEESCALGLQKRRGSKRSGLGNRRHKEGGISACLLCPSLHCWGWPSAILDSGGKRINLEKGIFLQNHIFSNSVEVYCIIGTKLLINHIHTLHIIDTYYDICDLLEGIFTIQLCWKNTCWAKTIPVLTGTVHTAGALRQCLGQLIQSELWPAGVFSVCFEQLSMKPCDSQELDAHQFGHTPACQDFLMQDASILSSQK